MAALCELSFWRLFHSLVRHGNSEAENTRARAVYDWTIDNLTPLRKCCVGWELELVGIVDRLAQADNILPAYELVKEKVEAAEGNDGMVEGLKEYESLRDSQLHIHHTPELETTLTDHCETFERKNLVAKLNKAILIAEGSVEHKKRKLAGVKDSMNFVMEQFEEGILVRRDISGLNRPIVVQKEAMEIGATYDRLQQRGFSDTGFPHIRLRPSNFVGILGHAGQGKSTVGRFMLYYMASQGKNVVHISLENDSEVEFQKFVLLHAHNPIYEDRYITLTYENFINGTLTAEQRGWLDEIGADFEANVGGRILIKQPVEASWEACKNIIEQADRAHPVDAAMIDYIQLIEPPSRNADERKNKMSSMIKDQRQYALNFGNGRKLILLSPVQGNEDGFSYAKDHEGVWPDSASGINQDKELARSMDVIIGVCQMGQDPNPANGMQETKLVFSNPKDRDKPQFAPFRASMTGCGWFRSGNSVSANVSPKQDSSAMLDTIGDDMSASLN
jgi:hypothetical protein